MGVYVPMQMERKKLESRLSERRLTEDLIKLHGASGLTTSSTFSGSNFGARQGFHRGDFFSLAAGFISQATSVYLVPAAVQSSYSILPLFILSGGINIIILPRQSKAIGASRA